MQYKIVHLPKERWKGQVLPIGYRTREYYDVAINRGREEFTIAIKKKKLEEPVTHTPEEYDFPDRLYDEYWKNACAWGVVEEGKLAAAIETCPLEFNRLRVTELWVDEKYQKQGIGHALMELAKEQALIENRRAVILETQSCNTNAIAFYLHEGFTLIGFDSCCYRNNDIDRKEVRLELGWFPERAPLSRDEVEIRMERPEEYYASEEMVRRAFWNKSRPGCDEHLLLHKLRDAYEYLPELSRIAVKDGEVIGGIFYSRAYVQDGDTHHQVLTFGPLAVSRKWKGRGIGELLLRETMQLAAEAGYPGIIIFGVPEYYPRVGFQTCDHFGITTREGKNFSAFMGIELVPGGFNRNRGKFYESDVFEQLPLAEVEEFNKRFPAMEKMHFPNHHHE